MPRTAQRILANLGLPTSEWVLVCHFKARHITGISPLFMCDEAVQCGSATEWKETSSVLSSPKIMLLSLVLDFYRANFSAASGLLKPQACILCLYPF